MFDLQAPSRLKLVLLFAAVLCGCSNPAPTKRPDLPTKLSHRTILSTNNPNELEHWVIYKQDKVTKALEQIEYSNGTSTYIYFGAGEFADKMVEYYPAKSLGAKRQMKSEVLYMPGSSDFQSHRAFFPDGTMEKVGKRLYDGTYKTITYFDDGLKMQMQQVFAADKFKLSETVYRKDGSKSQVTTSDPNRNVFVWNYAANGKLWMMYELPRWTWLAPGGKFYHSDGRTAKAEFKLYQDETVITYLDHKEREETQVSFRKQEQEMVILALNPGNGKPLWEQRWKHVSGKFDCTGQSTLVLTNDYKATSETYSRKIDREITMTAEGSYVAKVRVLKNVDDESEGVDYFLYPSGFLASKQTFVKSTTVTRMQKFADGVSKEKITQIDSFLIEKPDLECLSLPDIKLPDGDWSQ